jgi:hypothetical protein
MNTKHRISIVFALVLMFVAKTFGQEWEFADEFSYSSNECMTNFDATELSDGTIAVSSVHYFKSGEGDFYSYHSAARKLSAVGELLAEKSHFRESYFSPNIPYLIENPNGGLYMLATYSPDHDYTYFNYFKNYDNPPTDAILGLYKLNDDLEIEQSYEYSFPIDTVEDMSSAYWRYNPCAASGNIFIHSAILDGDCIVGAYTKNVNSTSPVQGNDSLFFFKMSLEGELLANVGVSMVNHGLYAWQEMLRREHIVKTDYGYIYYNPMAPSFFVTASLLDNDTEPNKAGETGTVFYLDNDFNILKIRKFQQPDGNPTQNQCDNMAILRSSHNTTYMATQANVHYAQSQEDCRLFEFDDDIEATQDYLTIVRQMERQTEEFDCVGISKSVAALDDHSLLFCYTLNLGENFNGDSWIVIERLDENFDTISTVFISNGSDELWCMAESINTTIDGGVLLTFESHKTNNPNLTRTTVVKFPAEAFVGIEEAHENGLKVAVAYPNPGKDVLNIRTGLKDARVEVYDMNGRMVYGQEITENVTSINAEDWPSGMYFWKVYTNQDGPSTASVTEAESGKWVKE